MAAPEPPLRKFIESVDYGRTTGRCAYALDRASLPSAEPHVRWREDQGFNEEAAVSNDPGLRGVMQAAREKGYVITERE